MDRVRLRGRIFFAALLLAAAPAIVAWGLGIYDAFELRRMSEQLEQSSRELLAKVEAEPVIDQPALKAFALEHAVTVRVLDRQGRVQQHTDPLFFPVLPEEGLGALADVFFGPQGPPDLQRFEEDLGPAQLRPEVQSALSGAEATAERRPAIPNMVVSYRAVPVSDGRVLYVARATRRSARMLFDFRFQLLKLTLWLILGAALMSLWLGWSVVAPLSRLQASIHSYVAGGQRRSLALERRDEIGALSRDFDRLTLRLEDRASETAQSAADLAHQLKNPIAAIRSSVEHLNEDTPIDGRRKERIAGALERSVMRLEQTVGALLELARLEGNLPKEERTQIDLFEVANQVAARRLETTSELSIKLQGEPAAMFGIEGRIDELVDNLVDNAIAFAQSEVALTVKREDSELVLIVEDDGPGISASDQAKVFQRFFSGRRPEQGGSGLGLPIVMTIAQAHGGHARLLKPGPLGGARFEVRFPRLP